MSIVINILMVLLVALCLLMLLIILMQRPKQEGLGAAFGGGMMDGMLGSGTTNFLQKATVYLTVGYFVLTMALDVIQARTSEARSLQGVNLEVSAAAASPADDSEPATTPDPATTPAPDTDNVPAGGEIEPPAPAPSSIDTEENPGDDDNVDAAPEDEPTAETSDDDAATEEEAEGDAAPAAEDDTPAANTDTEAPN
ncbi:MAG: preprotein translocase subunit SecG [Verrucomicrobiae bacterium]|nr:preprotein translocase subunit SecG [Verrucomicrobiae bacterium]